MTKLMEWLSVLLALVAVWLAIFTNTIEIPIFKQNPTLLYAAPIICIGLFGLYAVTIVLYRVFTFNNCEQAATELKKEIKEAKEDLIKRGFVF